MADAAAAPEHEIHLSLRVLRVMKNLPEDWKAVVDAAADLPEQTLVTVTEERLTIAARDLI